MLTQSIQQLKKLYDEDFVLWIDQTIEQIRQKDLENLDWEHLLEEIEDLGREQRNKVESYLIQTIKHLLMLQYWTSEKEYCEKGWMEEIDNFRIELEILFKSKTLYNYGYSLIDTVYQKAKRAAIRKTELPTTIFPQNCPYSFQEILDFDFFPE